MPRGKKGSGPSPAEGSKRPRVKGGFAIAQQVDDVLTLIAKDLPKMLAAETKLREVVTEQGEEALKKTFAILQIKRAGIQPKVLQVTKVTL